MHSQKNQINFTIFVVWPGDLMSVSFDGNYKHYCLLTIGAMWLMGTQNITYKIQVNGEGFAYYTEHIV